MAYFSGSTATGDRSTTDLALDFLNAGTSLSGGTDPLQSPQAFVLWLRDRLEPAAGAHPRPAAAPGGRAADPHRAISAPEARILQDEARRLRSAIAALVEAHHRRRALPEWAVFGLNRVLTASPWSWQVANTSGRAALQALPTGESLLTLLGPVALAAARLVSSVPADRLRSCASPRCGAWFVDTSKGGQRRWCSMARCGNREKAATHRAKVARGSPG